MNIAGIVIIIFVRRAGINLDIADILRPTKRTKGHENQHEPSGDSEGVI
jgi:hypothetical protein